MSALAGEDRTSMETGDYFGAGSLFVRICGVCSTVVPFSGYLCDFNSLKRFCVYFRPVN